MKYDVVSMVARWFLWRLAIYGATALLAGLLFLIGAGIYSVFAMDHDGKYAQENPELHKWFDNISSGKGMCCSYADGVAVSDVDVDTYTDKTGTHFRVRIPAGSLGAVQPHAVWVNVPDDAVVQEPNKFKLPVVWPFIAFKEDTTTEEGEILDIQIRCFMPGAMM